jgi:CheY-like chemotaxis protein
MKQSKGKNILVMDDDAPTRSFISAILEGEGHTVVACKNGKEGVAAFKRNRFDLVITDIAMPVIDGIDAIILIRNDDGTVPIIAMSGAERNESLLKFADYFSADDTISKPFGKKELLRMVEKALKEK